jgi:gliding motility-associated-like protein
VKASFIADYEIMIYNRWGNIIFHSRNISNSWDGTFDGTKVKDDVYSYLIVYANNNGERFKKYGHITVTR